MGDVKARGIRVPISLVIEMTEEQATRWANLHELPARNGDHVRAADVVSSVQGQAQAGAARRFGDYATVMRKR